MSLVWMAFKLGNGSKSFNLDSLARLKPLISRYCHIPTFGRGTIRRFHENASAMKKLAAHDFEDLLQVDFFINLYHAYFC